MPIMGMHPAVVGSLWWGGSGVGAAQLSMCRVVVLCDLSSPGVVDEVVVAVEGGLDINTVKTHVLPVTRVRAAKQFLKLDLWQK